MTEPSDLEQRLARYFATKPPPVVEFRCTATGCKRSLVLAAFDTGTELLIVTSMGNLRYQLINRSYELAPPDEVDRSDQFDRWERGDHIPLPRLALRVHGIDEPIVHGGIDKVRWPLTVRCRHHGVGTVGIDEVSAALEERRRSGKRASVGVHLRPAPSV